MRQCAVHKITFMRSHYAEFAYPENVLCRKIGAAG